METPSVDRSVQLLEAARRHAEAHGDREAITTAYAAARRAASSSLQVGSEGTRWEFYGRVRDRGSAALADRFRRLTESYEAAQYGGFVPGSDKLSELLEDAGVVVEQSGDEN